MLGVLRDDDPEKVALVSTGKLVFSWPIPMLDLMEHPFSPLD